MTSRHPTDPTVTETLTFGRHEVDQLKQHMTATAPSIVADDGEARTKGARAIVIEVIFDPGCPWCYVGKRRLEHALALRPTIKAELRWWPFLLNPDLPPDGIDRTTYLVRKFGNDPRMSRVFGSITDVGRAVGIDFSFSGIRRTPNTLRAHRLVRYAARYGRAEAMVEALFHNHFVKGADIGCVDVLIRIGGEVGLDTTALARYLKSDDEVQAVYAENARAHRLGINGVPSFVFSGAFVISGAQEPMVLARMLDVAREAAAAG